MTAPMYWVTASRPLSDVPGLAAAVGIQALALTARTGTGLVAAGFLAALACGVRSQVAWLTFPLIGFRLMRLAQAERLTVSRQMLIAIAVGGLIWFVPMVLLSQGPSTYLAALQSQGDEDLTGIVMLWTNPTPRQLLDAPHRAFVAPWGIPSAAALVILLALAGGAHLLRVAPLRLVTLGFAFGPYLAFDLLFQETVTTRYGLPLIVPMAYLAVRGVGVVSAVAARRIWRRAVEPHENDPARVAFAAGFAGVGVAVGMSVLSSYARLESPVFRMLGDMRAAATAQIPPPVLAMHRRAEFDLRRPIAWLGSGLPFSTDPLPSPPKHEWRELVEYWNEGGRRPVWFVADPLRSDLALIDDPPRRGSYRWPRPSLWPSAFPTLLGGMRPNEMDWYVIEPPDWYVGEGWALTPETAGVANENRKGPGLAPVQGWIRRRPEAVKMMVGGRHLAASAAPARVRAEIDGRIVDEWDVTPGFFLRMVQIPEGGLVGEGDYAVLTLSASSDQVAIEQFDAESADELIVAFSDGWHEPEYDARSGRSWRWTSDRATVLVQAPGHPLRLRVSGEAEAASSARVVIRAGNRTIVDQVIGRTFTFDATIPANVVGPGEGTITIETDQAYVPAERSSRIADRRRLGLKILEWQLVPAFEPDTIASSPPGYSPPAATSSPRAAPR
jgi:hypothetical protein